MIIGKILVTVYTRVDYVQNLDKYTCTILYNTDDFEVVDLCGLTAKLDTGEGDISAIDITVKQLVPEP